MSINVKSLDTEEVKKSLKECPKIIQDYVKSLEFLYNSQVELTKKCLNKIKQSNLK